jgi:probable HAF family extracellular repeat protein
VNRTGTTVGWAHNRQTATRAFRWMPGQSGLTDLNGFLPKKSAWSLIGADRINDNGWIVGHGMNGSLPSVFVLIPQ